MFIYNVGAVKDPWIFSNIPPAWAEYRPNVTVAIKLTPCEMDAGSVPNTNFQKNSSSSSRHTGKNIHCPTCKVCYLPADRNETRRVYTGWSKCLCAPEDYSTNNAHIIDELKMDIAEYIRNVDRAVLNTVFENRVRRVNKCLETGAGDTLNITCNFLYGNHQVHRDFLITL
jgi:hypothetical protein